MSTKTSISIHDAYVVGCNIYMIWDVPVRGDESGAMDKVAHESTKSECEPLERLLACTQVRRWVGISGRRSCGGCALDGVCWTREYRIH